MAKSAEGRQGVAEVKNRAGAKDIIEELLLHFPCLTEPALQQRSIQFQSLYVSHTGITCGLDVTKLCVLCLIVPLELHCPRNSILSLTAQSQSQRLLSIPCLPFEYLPWVLPACLHGLMSCQLSGFHSCSSYSLSRHGTTSPIGQPFFMIKTAFVRRRRYTVDRLHTKFSSLCNVVHVMNRCRFFEGPTLLTGHTCSSGIWTCVSLVISWTSCRSHSKIVILINQLYNQAPRTTRESQGPL